MTGGKLLGNLDDFIARWLEYDPGCACLVFIFCKAIIHGNIKAIRKTADKFKLNMARDYLAGKNGDVAYIMWDISRTGKCIWKVSSWWSWHSDLVKPEEPVYCRPRDTAAFPQWEICRSPHLTTTDLCIISHISYLLTISATETLLRKHPNTTAGGQIPVTDVNRPQAHKKSSTK